MPLQRNYKVCTLSVFLSLADLTNHNSTIQCCADISWQYGVWGLLFCDGQWGMLFITSVVET